MQEYFEQNYGFRPGFRSRGMLNQQLAAKLRRKSVDAQPAQVLCKAEFARRLIKEIKRNPYKAITCQKLDLSGADLRGVKDFHLLPLRGADLRGARLPKDLRNIDFTGANLSGADLSGCNLEGANLTGAQLVGAMLAGANLKNVKTGGSANFTNVKARGAVFSGDFGGCVFTGAHLQNANLGEGNFTNALMRGVNLRGAYGSPNLGGAKMQEADLTSIHFCNACLAGADASGANFEDAEIRTSNVDGMIVSNAKMATARFPGTPTSQLKGTPATEAVSPALKLDMSTIQPSLMPRRPAPKLWAGILGELSPIMN